MNHKIKLSSIIALLFFNLYAYSNTHPRLNFTDLISGSGTGIGDNLGSGIIVSLWGNNLGDTQNSSEVKFRASNGTVYDVAHVYYWKNADGQLPSGPANLYASHKMQEIAISIPNVAQGAGELLVIVNGIESNPLPFTIRNGDIYHVMTSGDDNNDGSFTNPWLTIDNALDEIDDPGATIYIHNNLSTGTPATKRAVYWNNASAASGYANQYGIIAYPNSQPMVIGRAGFWNYNTTGQVVSKFSVFTSNCDEGPNGQRINCATNPTNLTFGIQTSAYGRVIANTVTDRDGGCSSGQQGAIYGNFLSGDRVSGAKIFGNEVHEYGCAGSRKFHHATYMSIRSGSDNEQVDPWRFGWNYLHDNDVKNGIHQYDENNNGLECGSPNGTVIINDNVIINQAGSGINVGANCPWTNDFDIYNNIIINAGRAADWDGIDPTTSNGPYTSAITIQDGGLMGTMYIHDNTLHSWNGDNQSNGAEAGLGLLGGDDNVTILWENNVSYTTKDDPFVAPNWNGAQLVDNVSGDNNSWFYTGSNPVVAIVPTWDNGAMTTDPLITINNAQIEVDVNSPLAGSSNTTITHDVYGNPRSNPATLGAVENIDIPLSTNDEGFNNLVSIIPIPTNEYFSINLKNEILEKVVLYNELGQKLIETISNKVDVSNLSSGIYFVKITTQSGKMAAKKIIKN
ncbi:hypothetical protein MNBD_BACTEROID03-1052 [hydrothermal vent metagenome]|uniref:Secretion system C-terminal sorting domain-containing protein n=1 Tax=hydrothermal vent metagenome TaxID=652676 RepID=A0A3B0SVG0_9ZZZZ